MFPFPSPSVQVGLCPPLPPPCINEQAVVRQHGFITFLKQGGGTVVHGLVIDKPQHLTKLRPEILHDIFAQAGAMTGSHPLNMEIRMNGVRRVYQFGNSSPVIVQNMQ